MAQVPKIDSPCPLGIDEQRRLDGHCARCDKHVHRLDALSDDERHALLIAADGPICVSYRSERPRASRRGAGFGIAIAASLVSAGAYASDPPLLPPQPASATPVAPTPLLAQAPAKDCADEVTSIEMIEFVGGVSDPRDAHWADDSELPELPMREAAALDDTTAAAPTPPTPLPRASR
ncbi:hypothetical protein V1318_14390 [Lysobacter sp. CCNWLW3]|uniref:hypothetical protein n=1 Tax=unclassified Lysobacter TaxID=2635362 RepID=UPI002FD692FE